MDIKKAVALAYGDNTEALKVMASGKDKIAFEIIQKAKQYNIPMFQNKEIVDSIINCDIDDEIDVESHMCVAKILLWLNDIENNAQLSKI